MKKKSQSMRVLTALMNGEEIHRVWASKQTPLIAQPGNRGNELERANVPLKKETVRPKGESHYVKFWMEDEGIAAMMINSVKLKMPLLVVRVSKDKKEGRFNLFLGGEDYFIMSHCKSMDKADGVLTEAIEDVKPCFKPNEVPDSLTPRKFKFLYINNTR